MNSFVNSQVTEHLGIATLTRLKALNALTLDMIFDLKKILSAWQKNSEIGGVVICSSVPKAFCAGGDIRFFYNEKSCGLVNQNNLLEEFFTQEYALNYLIHHFSKPYIVLMDGIVMGGGMGIAQSSAISRIRVVTEHTRMAMPEVNIGLFPDVGASFFLRGLPGKIGLYLGLTGETINAADALYAGLADMFIPHVELITLKNTLSVGCGNHETFISQFAAPFSSLIDIENCVLAQHRPLIDEHFSNESVPKIIASLLSDPHPFSQSTAKILMRRSPLMLCVTYEQIRRAQTMSLADCLRMERTMMHHCFEHGDAIEGIRAAIIDKDNQPQWQPASLEEVTDEMVARFFEPVWSEQTHPLRALV